MVQVLGERWAGMRLPQLTRKLDGWVWMSGEVLLGITSGGRGIITLRESYMQDECQGGPVTRKG
jgi:hypothetical protein